MSRFKPYKIKIIKPQKACEPMVAYGSSVHRNKDFVQSIPKELMRHMIDMAIDDYEAGCYTPHSQMETWVKEQMGWKIIWSQSAKISLIAFFKSSERSFLKLDLGIYKLILRV